MSVCDSVHRVSQIIKQLSVKNSGLSFTADLMHHGSSLYRVATFRGLTWNHEQELKDEYKNRTSREKQQKRLNSRGDFDFFSKINGLLDFIGVLDFIQEKGKINPGSLSTEVHEPRAATESRMFPFFARFCS